MLLYPAVKTVALLYKCNLSAIQYFNINITHVTVYDMFSKYSTDFPAEHTYSVRYFVSK